MQHASLLFFLCLAVCHGRPITPTVPTSTVSTLDGTVPSSTRPPLEILRSGTPLTAVTTTSEDLLLTSGPRTTVIQESSESDELRHTETLLTSHVSPTTTSEDLRLASGPTTTVIPKSSESIEVRDAETLLTSDAPPTTTNMDSSTSPSTPTVILSTIKTPLLNYDFDLERCAEPDTACYFHPECLFFDSSKMTSLPLSQSFLESITVQFRHRLKNCAAAARISNGELELHHLRHSLSKDLTLTEYGLTLFADGRVRCSGCKKKLRMEMNDVTTTIFNLKKRRTTTMMPVLPSTTTTTTTTRNMPLPLPSTPSLHSDPANILTTNAPSQKRTSCEQSSGTNPWSIAIICLFVILIIVALALFVSICRVQRNLVQPATSESKIPPAWSSKRSSYFTYAPVHSPKWPEDTTEDFDERTPLPAVSPARTPTTVVRSTMKSLHTSEDKEKSGMTKSEASAKPPTPLKVKETPTRDTVPTKDTVSVTPSKDPEQIKLFARRRAPRLKKPDEKRPFDEGEELFKQPVRTSSKNVPPAPPGKTYEEVSM